ncbi:MAG: helix-turn-helix domain-containing protein [Alcanivoracaceae bacterium]
MLAWLKDQRQSKGMSMRELGDLLGVPHSFVQKVESGERRLDVVEYVWYCKALGISPMDGIRQID